MSQAAPPLAVEGISKAFPGVQALRKVSFDCRAGEIHALVGENGAGKSTLMRILAGAYQPDAGELRLNGTPTVLASPADARRRGVAMVYQDTRLVRDLDAAQNIHLGHEPGGFWVDTAAMRTEAQALIDRLGEDLDLRLAVRELSLAQRQIIEIARALGSEARLLILDEPTSALTPPEVDRLFAILRQLRAAGTSIIFISHRLPEVFAIADRITVMKDGEIVGTVPAGETDQAAIVAMMVGRDLALAFPPRASAIGPALLSVENLSAPGEFSDVSFTAHAGEILGFGGITGSGQQAIARALFGLVPAGGSIILEGKAVTIANPAQAIEQGIVYLPADRSGEGMFLAHSIAENIALPHVKDWARLGILDAARERQAVEGQIASLAVKTPSPRQAVGLLSGRQSAEGRLRPLAAVAPEAVHLRRADPGRRCRHQARDLWDHPRARRTGERCHRRLLRCAGADRALRPDPDRGQPPDRRRGRRRRRHRGAHRRQRRRPGRRIDRDDDARRRHSRRHVKLPAADRLLVPGAPALRPRALPAGDDRGRRRFYRRPVALFPHRAQYGEPRHPARPAADRRRSASSPSCWSAGSTSPWVRPSA